MKGFFKIFLVFGLIKKLLVLIFKFLYIFIKFLNLQFACVVALVGLVLFLTGAIPSSSLATTLFYVFLVLSLFVAIISTVKNLLFPRAKKEKTNRGGVQIVETETEDDGIDNAPSSENNETANEPPNVNSVQTKSNYPVYFAVKQNPNYVMAEYEDRYELFEKSNRGLVKIRTDYKS